MTPEAIQRINELARKAKAQGLTPEEAQEQKRLQTEKTSYGIHRAIKGKYVRQYARQYNPGKEMGHIADCLYHLLKTVMAYFIQQQGENHGEDKVQQNL